MARIRHLAIKTVDPERLAKFYVDVFEMEIVSRSDKGAVFLTDGYLNLALLKARADVPPGLNHFGFEIDDMEEIGERLEKAGMAGPEVRPNNPPYAEERAMDRDLRGLGSGAGESGQHPVQRCGARQWPHADPGCAGDHPGFVSQRYDG